MKPQVSSFTVTHYSIYKVFPKRKQSEEITQLFQTEDEAKTHQILNTTKGVIIKCHANKLMVKPFFLDAFLKHCSNSHRQPVKTNEPSCIRLVVNLTPFKRRYVLSVQTVRTLTPCNH